jgi:hypothetical protein
LRRHSRRSNGVLFTRSESRRSKRTGAQGRVKPTSRASLVHADRPESGYACLASSSAQRA